MLEKIPESVGHALRGQRAGIEHIAFRQLLLNREVPHLVVRSSAFENMGAIPTQFTADGAGISPPLEWHGVPAAAPCVVLIVEDADSPTPHPLVHAIAVTGGGDGLLTSGELAREEQGGLLEMGLNSYLERHWLPPDPPPGHGPHRYAFQVFALGEMPPFSGAPGRQEVLKAILGQGIAAGCLVGIYERARRQRVAETDDEAVPADDTATATA
jgi:phosphatidylethanolamine-binding protein (PEBP) family uncharacterized protein